MSSQNDKNELDNYGVWVKKPPKDIKADADITDESFSLDAELPDFDNPGDSDKTEDSLNDFDFSIDEVKEETIEDPFADIDFETEENGNAEVQENETVEISENTESTSESEQVIETAGTEDDFNIDDITSDISFDDLDDYYIFDERYMSARGARNRLCYELGDKVEVIVSSVNLTNRQITFTLVQDRKTNNHISRKEKRKQKPGEKKVSHLL